MKKRFFEGQIIGFLREVEADMPVNKVCRKHGSEQASYYLWRSRFGGMSVFEAKRLKDLKTGSCRPAWVDQEPDRASASTAG